MQKIIESRQLILSFRSHNIISTLESVPVEMNTICNIRIEDSIDYVPYSI